MNNIGDILNENMFERMKGIVDYSWEIFSKKVGSELIRVNKEASMQLKYSKLIADLIPLFLFDEREELEIDLEVTFKGKRKEIDILLTGRDCNSTIYKIGIELKCYKEFASSGDKRGALDIFMKEAYIDLFSLEEYCIDGHIDLGISLIMSDYKHLVKPRVKIGKTWDHDISDGASVVAGMNFNTVVGDKKTKNAKFAFTLNRNYSFKWNSYGNYYFTKVIGC